MNIIICRDIAVFQQLKQLIVNYRILGLLGSRSFYPVEASGVTAGLRLSIIRQNSADHILGILLALLLK
jgi:hypothetical protein